MRKNLHTKGMGDFRHFPADSPKPDNADGFMRKFMQWRNLKIEEGAVCPAALMDGLRMLRDVHGVFQNECEDRLRDGIGGQE